MLSAADVAVVLEASKELSALGLEAAFLVPTKTGLEKSIMDATAPVRLYLSASGIHDYDVQQQGEEHKVLLPAYFVRPQGIENSRASLYRPVSKSGDPRIWFSGLPKYAAPGDLLLVFHDGEGLAVVNATNTEVWASRNVDGGPLSKLLHRLSARAGSTASELLSKLRAICARGYVPSVRHGDTGVGATLESLLEISTNSSKAPDYKGIELKASRKLLKGKRNRVNLFSQVPDWDASTCKNGLDLIRNHGYPPSAPQRLCCTVAEKPNAQGLYLKVDENKGILRGLVSRDGGPKDVCAWQLSTLQERLREKHDETFWVKADVREEPSGSESFLYSEVEHTRGPMVTALAALLACGVVTMDFTLKMKESGKTRDHGYLFKILPANLGSLFPPSKRYELVAK